ncbi:pro-sigmaK processing inhibitor BofA [Anaerobranca californiensis DSM 14826]|jgi:inhibitor of the pro-sigma K processing machinery|uniref:Pro-sigmaK processing inhibitor BofA n=1 Tax=Anaerobranca californiensis DSM 14826 TaxID=1120989 RepID=A0A1M6R6I5_9FIRM|nr:pro-sigmaK processing inhibitor BofA family protein [Anaerobranca californiensis]SHK28010.1 pro-sigmaK processing inhibitor BofA [Anaerobranca californiensis DSM 14826]
MNLKKLLLQSLGGITLLLMLHFFGKNIGLYLPINLVTLVTAGILGLPGIILLVILGKILL